MSWKCECDTDNDDSAKKCSNCNLERTTLPDIESIMQHQQLLFDGYMRINILSNLSNNASKIMTTDVVKVCDEFFVVNIQLLQDAKYQESMDEYSWMSEIQTKLHTLHDLAHDDLYLNDEWFIGYEILKQLIKHQKDEDYLSQYHNLLGALLYDWNSETTHDKDVAKEAKFHYERSIELDPETWSYRQDFGEFLEEEKEYELAKKHLLKAIELDPDNARCMTLCGYCYHELGDNDTASEYFKKAIEVDPEDAEYYVEFADYLKDNLGNFTEAKQYLETAIEFDEENYRLYQRLAVVYRDGIKDYAESEKYYLKALQLNPDHHGTNNSYGYLLYLKDELVKAKDIFENRKEHANMIHDFWFHVYYGLVNEALGNKEIANESLLTAVEFSRTNVQYKDILLSVPLFKENDSRNDDFYDRFQKLIRMKLEEQ